MINESHVVRENTTDWKTNVSMIYFEKSQNSKIFKSIKTRNQVLHYKLFSKSFFGKLFAALHSFCVAFYCSKLHIKNFYFLRFLRKTDSFHSHHISVGIRNNWKRHKTRNIENVVNVLSYKRFTWHLRQNHLLN